MNDDNTFKLDPETVRAVPLDRFDRAIIREALLNHADEIPDDRREGVKELAEYVGSYK